MSVRDSADESELDVGESDVGKSADAAESDVVIEVATAAIDAAFRPSLRDQLPGADMGSVSDACAVGPEVSLVLASGRRWDRIGATVGAGHSARQIHPPVGFGRVDRASGHCIVRPGTKAIGGRAQSDRRACLE